MATVCSAQFCIRSFCAAATHLTDVTADISTAEEEAIGYVGGLIANAYVVESIEAIGIGCEQREEKVETVLPDMTRERNKRDEDEIWVWLLFIIVIFDQDLNQGRDNLLKYCLKKGVGIVYYDECLLRYSNEYFFSTVTYDTSFVLRNVLNVSQSGFKQAVAETMNQTAAQAARGSEKKFATKKAKLTQINETLYTLAQCTPDLSSADCGNCLQTSISSLQLERIGSIVLGPSCGVRFVLYPFYSEALIAPYLYPQPQPHLHQHLHLHLLPFRFLLLVGQHQILPGILVEDKRNRFAS
ncbi:Gnk2-homologous domain [Dillenia turbinata]|uniref:Gnk2-homologous domain n=1 Tax=Dillenia turbinata TaxID=194707 RepID=A0AAN8VMU6_9MAGN